MISPKSAICWFFLLPLIFQCKSYMLHSRVRDDPCDLAFEIDHENNSPLIEQSQFPLFTCIVGYHSFSDSSKPSGGEPGNHGPFGTHSDDFNNCMLNENKWWLEALKDTDDGSLTTNHGLSAEMRCIKKVIFKSEKLMTLYKRLCRPPMVKAVECGDPEVVALVPSYKYAFAMDVSNPPNNDLFKFAEFLDGLLDKAESVSSAAPTPHTNKQEPSSGKDANTIYNGKCCECGKPAVVSSAIPETNVEDIRTSPGMINGTTVAPGVVGRATNPRENVTSTTQHKCKAQAAQSPSTTPSSKSESPVPSSVASYRNTLKSILILLFIYMLVRIINLRRTLMRIKSNDDAYIL